MTKSFFDEALRNDYVVTQEDIKLNNERILERMPEKKQDSMVTKFKQKQYEENI